MKRGSSHGKRKAMLMSVVTLLFLGALIILAFSSLSTRSLPVEPATRGNFLAHLGADVGDDVLGALLGVHVEDLSRSASSARLLLDPAGLLSSAMDHAGSLDDYAGVVEGIYATESNLDIGLSNVDPAFLLDPFGVVVRINRSEFMLDMADKEDLQSMDMTISVDTSPVSLTTSPSPSGDVSFSLLVRDSLEVVILNETVLLDPGQANSPFTANFLDGSSLSVSVGSGADRLLTIQADDLEANLSSLRFTFDDPGVPLSIDAVTTVAINQSPSSLSGTRPLFSLHEIAFE